MMDVSVQARYWTLEEIKDADWMKPETWMKMTGAVARSLTQ